MVLRERIARAVLAVPGSLGFGLWGLVFGVWGLGFGVWGLGFRVWGFGFGFRVFLVHGVWGSSFCSRVSRSVGSPRPRSIDMT